MPAAQAGAWCHLGISESHHEYTSPDHGKLSVLLLTVEEEQNSSNTGRRATGDYEETSLKQSTLLCCFSSALFNAAVDADGQNLVDEIIMIVYPKMLGFYFQKQQEEIASF